jgi:hypothetical protein
MQAVHVRRGGAVTVWRRGRSGQPSVRRSPLTPHGRSDMLLHVHAPAVCTLHAVADARVHVVRMHPLVPIQRPLCVTGIVSVGGGGSERADVTCHCVCVCATRDACVRANTSVCKALPTSQCASWMPFPPSI